MTDPTDAERLAIIRARHVLGPSDTRWLLDQYDAAQAENADLRTQLATAADMFKRLSSLRQPTLTSEVSDFLASPTANHAVERVRALEALYDLMGDVDFLCEADWQKDVPCGVCHQCLCARAVAVVDATRADAPEVGREVSRG